MCYVLYEKNNKKHLFLFGGTKIKHYICIIKQILKVMIVINRTIAAAITDSIDGNHGSFSYHAHCAAAVLLFAYKHALKIHISALRHPSHHDKFSKLLILT